MSEVRSRTAVPAAAATVALGLVGAVGLLGAGAAPASAFDGRIKVQYDEEGDSVDGRKIAEGITAIGNELSKEEFTQEVVQRAFDDDGGDYNVIIANLDEGNDRQLRGEKLYASVTNGSVYYGLWIFESGTFTNTGDGGYQNWAFKGWFDRGGDENKTVTFRRP